MAFLALASQKSLLQLERNFLGLQQVYLNNELQEATATMRNFEQAYDEYEDNPQYQYWSAIETKLEAEQNSLETQITAIDNELNSLKNLLGNSIKSSCTLNIGN